jgi:hypothetical protein
LDIVKQLKQKLLNICINTFLCINMIKIWKHRNRCIFCVPPIGAGYPA